MRRSKHILFSSILMLCAWQSHANDLLHYYQLALENDATFQSAKSEFEASQYNVDIAKSALKPQLSANAQAGETRVKTDTTSNNNANDSIGLTAGMSLYDRSNYLNLDQAQLNYEIATLQYDNAKQDLMIRLAQAYFSLLSAQDQYIVAKSQSDAIKSQLDQAQQRLDVGLGTRTDLLDAKARYQQTQADLIRTQNQIDINNELIAEITGESNTVLANLHADADTQLRTDNRQQWLDTSVTQNVQVRIAQLAQDIAELELKKQGSKRLPTLRVDADHNWNSENQQSAEDNETSRVNLSLNLPIYQGGGIRAQRRQAAASLNSARQLSEQARREAKTQTSSAYLTLVSTQEQIAALKQAVEAGEGALHARKESFQAGLATNLDVLNAQRDLAESQRQLAQARYDLLLQRLNLERAAGTLSEDSLQLINALFTDLSPEMPRKQDQQSK